MSTISTVTIPNFDPGLPSAAMQPTPQVAGFEVQMAEALKSGMPQAEANVVSPQDMLLDCPTQPETEFESEFQLPERSDTAPNENTADSSISASISAPELLPPVAQLAQRSTKKVEDPRTEAPRPEMMQPVLDASQIPTATLAPEIRTSSNRPTPPETQPPIVDVSLVTPRLNRPAIDLAALQSAKPVETKIAADIPIANPVSEPASVQTMIGTIFTGPLASAERIEQPTRTLDISANDWTSRLSHEILAASDRAEPELTFRLTPKHLGTLDVGLIETPSGLVIELRPSSDEAKAIVAREEPRLIEALRQHGVAVADPLLQSGANGDGRHSRNGAIPRPFLPFPETDRNPVQDQDQRHDQPKGRFA